MPFSSPRPRGVLARALAFAVTSVLLAAPAGAQAAEKGLQTDLSWGTTAAEQEKTLAALEGTNVQWIRLDISWRNTETTPGAYDAANLALTDRAVALAEQAGAKVIMAVSESPEWASGSSVANTPPRDAQDYANFVRDMAARYAGRVAYWEIWNEPNHPRFWNPAPDAAGYARLLEAAAPAVRAGDPAAKVLFAGLAFNDYEYLERVYAAAPSIGDSFDAMATHPYTANGQSPDKVDLAPDGRMTTTTFLAFEEVRKVMRAHGDEQPMLLTEFGWSTNSLVTHPLGGVTEAQQASYLALAFELIEAAPYIEVAVVYNFRNNYWANDADNWEDQLGLLRTDFSPKPAYTVFKEYAPPSTAQAEQGTLQPPVDETPATTEVAPVQQSAPAAPEPRPQAENISPAVIPPTGQATVAELRPTIELSVRRLYSSKATASSGGRLSLRLTGRVTAARKGVVRIVVERRSGSAWVPASTLKLRLRSSRFAGRLAVTRGARWRVRAVYATSNGGVLSSKPVSIRG